MVLSAEVGLSERISLQALQPFRTFDISGRQDLSAEGAGDLELTARTSLTPPEGGGRFAAVAFYGAALPTGKGSRTEVLEENGQFSRGVVSVIAGGEASLRVGERSRIHGLAVTQVPVGDDDGLRFAATRAATATFSSPFGGSGVRWFGGLSYAYAGRDQVNVAGDGRGPVAVPNRGGQQTRLVGGIVFPVTRRQNLGIQANHLLDADLSGDQLTARTEYVLGWQVSLGTHRHR